MQSVPQRTVERDVMQEEAAARRRHSGRARRTDSEIVSSIVAVWKGKTQGKRPSEVSARCRVWETKASEMRTGGEAGPLTQRSQRKNPVAYDNESPDAESRDHAMR